MHKRSYLLDLNKALAGIEEAETTAADDALAVDKFLQIIHQDSAASTVEDMEFCLAHKDALILRFASKKHINYLQRQFSNIQSVRNKKRRLL